MFSGCVCELSGNWVLPQSYEEISELLRPSALVELLARSIRRDETTVTPSFL